jgi:hypothetical protein
MEESSEFFESGCVEKHITGTYLLIYPKSEAIEKWWWC